MIGRRASSKQGKVSTPALADNRASCAPENHRASRDSDMRSRYPTGRPAAYMVNAERYRYRRAAETPHTPGAEVPPRCAGRQRRPPRTGLETVRVSAGSSVGTRSDTAPAGDRSERARASPWIGGRRRRDAGCRRTPRCGLPVPRPTPGACARAGASGYAQARPAITAASGRVGVAGGGRRGPDRLEALELRVAEVERLRGRHTAVGLAELLGAGPGLEVGT